MAFNALSVITRWGCDEVTADGAKGFDEGDVDLFAVSMEM